MMGLEHSTQTRYVQPPNFTPEESKLYLSEESSTLYLIDSTASVREIPRAWSISPRQIAAGESFTGTFNCSNFVSGHHSVILQYNWGGSSYYSGYRHLAGVGSSLQPQVLARAFSPDMNSRTNLLSVSEHLHLQFRPSDLPDLRKILPREEPVVIQLTSSEFSNTKNDLMFWASLLGLIVTPLTLLSTAVVQWISLRRARAEAILLRAQDSQRRRAELEKLKLENLKLAFELNRLRKKTPDQKS
jgi:hypothetical protein